MLAAYLEDDQSHLCISDSEVDSVECMILITVLQHKHEAGEEIFIDISAIKLRLSS